MKRLSKKRVTSYWSGNLTTKEHLVASRGETFLISKIKEKQKHEEF